MPKKNGLIAMDDVFFANLGLTFSANDKIREDQLIKLNEVLKSKKPSSRPPIPEFTRIADEFQQLVIEATAQTIRLIAPAGSGKTQTMINRVLKTIRDGVEPERMLLLTFDNSAVDALKSKLEESIGSSIEARSNRNFLDGLQITTLNSFSNRALGDFASSQRKQVATDRQRFRSLKNVRDDFKAKYPDLDNLLPKYLLPQYFLDLFSLLKNETLDPRNPDMGEFLDLLISSKSAASIFEPPKNEPLSAERTMKLAQVVAALYVLYDRELQHQNVMDFDDQKLRLYAEITKSIEALEAIQQRYDEVIVDEFQDINRLDFELIKLIAAKSTLVVTGDDDQAIYGFRGCTPEYIIDLSRHLERPVTSFELQMNYRSPANIVRHANQLIKHNLRRLEKTPIPYHPHDATITLIPGLSSALEANALRNLILANVGEDASVKYKDIAILYRTNAQSLPLQIEFLLAGIPYSVRREDNVLASESLAKMLSLLRAKIARKAATLAVIEDQLNVLKSYFRFMNPESEDALRKRAAGGTDLLAEENRQSVSLLMPSLINSKFYSDFHELVAAGSLSDELDIISRRFGNGLKGMIGSLEEAMNQEVPLAEVFDMARDYEGNTQDFLDMIGLALDKGRETRAGDNPNGVSLLTYFKSKGRQWHTVILLSCNEGFIPHTLAPVEEERRLFYVAMTRASSDLVLSYVENAVHRRLQPSRFLYEAGLLPDPSHP